MAVAGDRRSNQGAVRTALVTWTGRSWCQEGPTDTASAVPAHWVQGPVAQGNPICVSLNNGRHVELGPVLLLRRAPAARF